MIGLDSLCRNLLLLSLRIAVDVYHHVGRFPVSSLDHKRGRLTSLDFFFFFFLFSTYCFTCFTPVTPGDKFSDHFDNDMCVCMK